MLCLDCLQATSNTEHAVQALFAVVCCFLTQIACCSLHCASVLHSGSLTLSSRCSHIHCGLQAIGRREKKESKLGLAHTKDTTLAIVFGQQQRYDAGDGKKKKETKLGLAHTKEADFGDWYSEVVVESEMISYYDVSGTVISHCNNCTGPQETCQNNFKLSIVQRRVIMMTFCASGHTEQECCVCCIGCYILHQWVYVQTYYVSCTNCYCYAQ